MSRATLFLSVLLAGQALAGPRIGIIIDDLGNRGALDRRAVALDGPVAMAVLPDTPYARSIANSAHAAGKEVLVHMPMQSVNDPDPPPGFLSLDTTRAGLVRRVEHALASVPHAAGLNNHMGSLMTRHPGDMNWLMEELARHPGLFFVDSRTTPRTVAAEMAREDHVPTLSRDVFLDDVLDDASVSKAFDRLLTIARRKGQALAIGHPHPVTLGVLERRLPELKAAGVTLVPLSAMLSKETQWQPYLSQSPTAAKRSKLSR